jgi:CheY-like chemotaxis protein
MPDVPDALIGDPGRLRQVLLNLVGNAIKFTTTGEISVSVEQVATRSDEVELAFCVADTGIGISPEAQERVFNPFVQADGSTTRYYGGTGLGLAISRRLVELMGGSIHVTSRPGAGSRFCFTTRFLRVPEDMVIPVPEQLNLAGNRVLIVDDIAINRNLLGHLLGKWRMKGDAVSSAEEALLQLRRAEERGIRYDLILLDVHMPEIDGWSLATGIRDNPAWDDCRIIMMPSVGEKGDSWRCRELRLDGYLMKPVIPDELEEMIKTALGRPPEPEPTMPAAPGALKESLRILVAEDVEINQKLATRILEKLGHRVTIAANGREAVSRWETGDFDLILMDIQMPEMDGFEAAGMIREREKGTDRHIPIAAMTAFALKGDDEKCLAAGMDGYISKPVKAEDIRITIEQLTRNGEW